MSPANKTAPKNAKHPKKRPRKVVPHERKAPESTCGAKTSSGSPCRKPPMQGATRCRLHGGASPNSLDAARRRLLAAADPAAARLVDMATNTDKVKVKKVDKDGAVHEVEVPRYDDRVQLRAAEAVLDRAGLPRMQAIEHSGEVEVTTRVLEFDPGKFPKPKSKE